MKKKSMIEIRDVENLDCEELSVYTGLTEAQLRNSEDVSDGLFICESPKVIRVALQRGYEPVSLLCERKHITGDAKDIVGYLQGFDRTIPIFTGEREILKSLTGYVLTRGVLCAMKRKRLPDISDICKDARIVAVLQSITDTTNIGAIFRAASGLGVDAVILSDDTCDPLNRRAVRVSMGTVFSIPWTMIGNPAARLKELEFTTMALALSNDSVSLDNKELKQYSKIAVIFGTEGDGLPEEIISDADYTVKIPMYHGTDSLNVASAAAVTFWELRKK